MTFMEHAAREPGRLAFDGTGGAVTYGDLAASVQERAAALREAGLGPGDRVMHAGDDQRETLTWLLACMLADTVLLPLSGTASRAFVEETATRTGASGEAVADGTVVRRSPATPSDGPMGLRAIIPTSGTTGVPKAVWIDDGMVAAATANAIDVLRLGPRTRFLDLIPAHTVGHLFLIGVPTLAAGGTVVTARFHPSHFADVLERHEPDLAILLPVMVKVLETRGPLAESGLGRLTTLATGASTVPPGMAQRVLQTGVDRYVHMFGLTECLAPVFAHEVTDPEGDGTLLRGPLGDAQARLDDEGELLLRGSAVTNGYDSAPGVTAAAFADGWFRTGDRFERDGDAWRFAGRVDEIVKVNGFKVSPSLTEAVINDLQGVAACAVGAEPHASGADSLVGLVEGQIEPAAVIAACRRRLDAHQVPRRVHRVDAIPHNAMGKVDRVAVGALLDKRAFVAKLRALVAAGDPAAAVVHAAAEVPPPRNWDAVQLVVDAYLASDPEDERLEAAFANAHHALLRRMILDLVRLGEHRRVRPLVAATGDARLLAMAAGLTDEPILPPETARRFSRNAELIVHRAPHARDLVVVCAPFVRVARLLHATLAERGWDVVYLVDQSGLQLLGPIGGLGGDWAGSVTALRELATREGPRRLHFVGVSGLGYPSLRMAAELGASTAITFGAWTDLSPGVPEAGGYAENPDLKRMRKSVPRLLGDLRPLLAAAEPRPRVHAWFGERATGDREQVERIADLEGVQLHPIADSDSHNAFAEVIDRGLLEEALAPIAS